MVKYICMCNMHSKGVLKMKKIKDFFYDKNDIIIVLLIIAIAAFVIYTCINSIMGYPEQYAKEMEATSTEATTTQATEPSTVQETVVENISFEINDDDTSSSIAKKLQEASLVDSAEDFEAYVNDEGKTGSLKSGTFKIPKGSSHEEILDIIS